jgi:hypothetical protein
MPSSELEALITRNSQFLTVRRSGSGDGVAGLCSSITGEHIRGLGGGRIPEYSYMRDEAPRLVRGWRNILHELITMRFVWPSREIKRLLGTEAVNRALDYGTVNVPMATPEPTRVWLDGSGASGWSGTDGDPYA